MVLFLNKMPQKKIKYFYLFYFNSFFHFFLDVFKKNGNFLKNIY